MKKGLKITGIALAVLFAVLGMVPYAIPLSKPGTIGAVLPFENSAYIKVEGETLHYRTHLPEDEAIKGKLLMVHGLGGSTFSFEQNASVLAGQGYLVVTVDLPGFGYSSRNVKTNHAQVARAKQVWTLLKTLDAGLDQELRDQKWHLAGHSMGGGTIIAMASAEPNRTQSLVVIDGALFENNRGNNLLTKIPPVIRWGQVALEHLFINEVRIEAFLRSAYGRPPTTSEVLGYLAPLKVPGTARSAAALIQTAENLPPQVMTTLDMPVLAIWGENDTWVPLSDTQRMATYLSDLLVNVIDGAGHCPMETHPEIFNAMVVDWLNSH